MTAGPSDARSRANSLLLVAALALSVFPLLLVLRGFDDNTLTSWRWAAYAVDPVGVFLVQSAAVAASYMLSLRFPRGESPGILLFMLAAATAAIFWPLPEIVIDSARYFTQAKHLEVNGVRYFLREWGGEIDAWTDMPLMPFVYGLLFRYLGESRFAVQALNSLLFSLTAVATFHAGRILWDREAGLFAGLLLLGIPYLHTQVPLMLTDVPAMCFVTLSLLTSLLALLRGGGWLLAPALPVVLAATVKYSTWPLLAAGVPLVFLAAAPKAGLRTAARRCGALTLVPGCLLCAFALWKRDVIAGQIGLLTSFQWQGLTWWRESHLSTFFFQTHPFVTALALWATALAAKRRDVSCTLPLGLVALLLAMGVERARYLLVVFPMVALLAGYGLAAVRSRRLRTFTACCTVLGSLTVSFFFYRPFLMRISLGNLKAAAALLDARGAAAADVHTLPPNSPHVNPAVAVPLLDLYYSGKIAYEPGEPPGSAAEAARRSPFRFSWQYRNPKYYDAGEEAPVGERALVVISGDADPPLPPAVEERTRLFERHSFTDSSGVYRFRTLLSVYLPGRRQPRARRKGRLRLSAGPEEDRGSSSWCAGSCVKCRGGGRRPTGSRRSCQEP